jgi:hypothetical protein
MVYLAFAILAAGVAITAGLLGILQLHTRVADLETVIAAMHHNPTLWPPHPDEQEPTP